MIGQLVRCDAPNCPSIKGEGNRWLLYTIKDFTITICPWDDRLATKKAWGHLCSDSCAIKVLVKTVRPEIPKVREDNADTD